MLLPLLRNTLATFAAERTRGFAMRERAGSMALRRLRSFVDEEEEEDDNEPVLPPAVRDFEASEFSSEAREVSFPSVFIKMSFDVVVCVLPGDSIDFGLSDLTIRDAAPVVERDVSLASSLSIMGV